MTHPDSSRGPSQDGRVPRDPDGNEELERELEDEEEPASRRMQTDRGDANGASQPSRWDFETEDTGEWVATERFTLDDEIDDTWPIVPSRFLDD